MKSKYNLKGASILLLMFLLSSCGELIHTIGTVKEKKFVDEYWEVIPPGYRFDCGLTIEGKYDCGMKYFFSKIVYHRAEYYFLISDENKCEFVLQTDEETYLKTELYTEIELDLHNYQLGDCATDKNTQKEE
jgi:hypothetical protein